MTDSNDRGPAPSDEELMLLSCKKGGLKHFDILVVRVQQQLLNHFRCLGVYNECEDLAQETLLRIWKARKRYRVSAKFQTYLFHVARNVWRDHLRKQHRRERKHSALRAQPEPEPSQLSTGSTEELQQALLQLSPSHREVVVLRMLDECSIKEISELVGIAEGTVKSRIHHGMQKLQEHMNQASS